MSIAGEVHWHEGLFLQPHHLQTMQRCFNERFSAERRLIWSYSYGLVESQLSRDALENLVVQFDRLRIVMPSGQEVSFPDRADLPARDIKQAFETGRGSFTVYIGIPLWYGERGNTVEAAGEEASRVKRLYRVGEIQRSDENTGENPQTLRMRRINARLLLDGDDTSDLEVLPVLKIAHATGETVGLPRQDPAFIPPCLILGGSPVLRDLVRDLANQVEASRKELVIQISRAGFQIENLRGMQFEQMLRLRILNHFAAKLPQMATAPGLTPFDMYLELRALLAELAALYPDRDPFAAPDYDHDNPALPFRELSNKIRPLLRGIVAAQYLKAPFEKDGDILVAALTDEHLRVPNEYFLGIRTREDPRALATLVENPNEFKLMARSMADRAIFGVKLLFERNPPLQLPSETGLTYFRLIRGESARMWEKVGAEKSLAARWPGMEAADHKLTLYMTLPAGKEGA